MKKLLILCFLFFCSGRVGRSLLETRRRRLVFFTITGLILVAILAIAMGTTLGRGEKGKDGVKISKPTNTTSKISV